MPTTSSNTPASASAHAHLRSRLQGLREGRDLTFRDLAARVGYSFGYLAAIEGGTKAPTEGVVRALDRFYDTDGALMELYRVGDALLIAQSSRAFVRREQGAARIRVFASSLIPGLLQTADYARELIRIGLPGVTPAQVEAYTAARITRQEMLTTEGPYVSAVLDEAAVARMPTGSAREGQLRHLLALGQHPRVSVRLLPFGAGLHPMLGGCLTLLDDRTGQVHGQVESFDAGVTLESGDDLIRSSLRFDSALAMSLTEAESAEMISVYLRGTHD